MRMLRQMLALVLTVLLLSGCGGKTNETSGKPVESISGEDVGTCTLTFITIGKGDAFLLTTPQGKHYMVDTGKEKDYDQIAQTLQTKGVTRLDGIFLSHGHKDHAGGLKQLLKDFPTEKVYISGVDNVSYHQIDPRAAAAKARTELVELWGGETLDLGGVTAEVWMPKTVDAHNENNNSLVLRLSHGANSFLLMGDAEMEEETMLMASNFPLQSTLLKLGHHGETDATSPAFLNRVKPQIALITGNVEENPDSVNETIAALLRQRDVTVYYSEGETLGLDVISDGQTLQVTPVASENEEIVKETSAPQSAGRI